MGFIERLAFHYPDAYVRSEFTLTENTLREIQFVKFPDGSPFPKSYFSETEVVIGSGYRHTTALEDKVVHLLRCIFENKSQAVGKIPVSDIDELFQQFLLEAKNLIRLDKLNTVLSEK